MTDEFTRRAIKTLADDLPPEVREACKARAKAEHMTLGEQLYMLRDEAMKNYKEPAMLAERSDPERKPDFKTRASGGRNET